MSAPVTLAAIDAGSNAIRLLIASASSATEFSVVAAERVPVRLGHHTFTRGALDPKTIEAAVVAFARFRKLFDEHGVERYRAVATSALRNANNREDLLDRLFRELEIEVEVIDGQEEARLVRKAVLATLPGDEPDLIADLGGGSLEVTEQSRNEWLTSSMRIGTVRLLETFDLSGSISDDEARMIRRYVASLLRSSLPEELYGSEPRSAVACGGNAEALAMLFGSADKKGTPSLKLSALEEVLPQILERSIDSRMSKFGVRKDRAEVIGVAALVFATLGEELGLKRLRVPAVGIRDGILYDLAEATVGELAPGREPATVGAARAFAARIGHNTAHGEQVRRICAQLFSQLKELHGLPKRLGETLELAALLHDVGEVVHRRSHHKHSEYLVLHGRIPGLESPQRELVAAICRAHRKSTPDAKKHSTYAGLDSKQQDQVQKLTAILRVADSLDTDHRQRVVAVTAEVKSKKVLLNLSVERNGKSAVALDLQRTEAFEEIFARKIVTSVSEVAAEARRTTARAE